MGHDAFDAENYIRLGDLQPTVELAACYDMREDHWFPYRVSGAHFLLVKSGHIEAQTPDEHLHAYAGDMLCFRHTNLNHYGNRGRTFFYEAHMHMAQPPNHQRTVWLDDIGALPTLVKLGSNLDAMRQVFDTYCLELAQAGPSHKARVTSAIWEMLALLSDSIIRQNRPSRRMDEWQRARIRLEGELSKKLQVRDVAAEIGLSVDHFIRGFKKRFGISPKQYRTHALLRHAAHRLTTEDVPIKRLSFELGFADAYSFTRAFKQYLGILPRDLRAGVSISEGTKPTQDWPAPQLSIPSHLFRMNQHVLPAGAGTDAYKKFWPKF